MFHVCVFFIAANEIIEFHANVCSLILSFSSPMCATTLAQVSVKRGLGVGVGVFLIMFFFSLVFFFYVFF